MIYGLFCGGGCLKTKMSQPLSCKIENVVF